MSIFGITNIQSAVVNEVQLKLNCKKQFEKTAGRNLLGGGFQYVLFLPLPGEMIQFDEHKLLIDVSKPSTIAK